MSEERDRPVGATLDLKKSIREVPDFPKPGVNFYDLSTLFRDATAYRVAVSQMVQRYRDRPIEAVAGIEARGFILAAAMAYELGVGLILVRKFGKLPGETESETYALEYGEAHIEVHRDAVGPGQRVVIVDDVLATGGTAAATASIIERLGGKLDGYAFLVELGFLQGRGRLGEAEIFSLLHYD